MLNVMKELQIYLEYGGKKYAPGFERSSAY